MDALHRTLLHSREVASAGVVVDAKDAAASAFYKKYGFLVGDGHGICAARGIDAKESPLATLVNHHTKPVDSSCRTNTLPQQLSLDWRS
jgi:hypothetical protein